MDTMSQEEITYVLVPMGEPNLRSALCEAVFHTSDALVSAYMADVCERVLNSERILWTFHFRRRAQLMNERYRRFAASHNDA